MERADVSEFKRADGGVRSARGDELYYLGLIDILTPFNYKKKGELVLKSIITNSKSISSQPADKYLNRLQNYISNKIK